MNEIVTTVFGLFGGLALFLYGMNRMGEALQKAAGEKMKHILGILTRNPLMGALAGCLVTAILQSSSATTVMTIGFVSAGIMTLPQAISVIFGSNIGTTMTAQLIAFDIGDYIYPIIFIGFLINFLAKKEKVKNIGLVIFAFGLLFEGIEIMGSTMEPLATSPIFTELMAKVSHIPVLGVGLGLIMTLIVQSSSATIAVLQSFASQPAADGVSSVIGLTGAIPILLGDNIGTTITALLASVGQSKNAKRAAIAHSCFNISGSVVFLFLIPAFASFIRMISPHGPEYQMISRQIANAHTTFNVVCTLIWLPLLPLMVKIVKRIIPGDDAQEMMGRPLYLDEHMIAQPVAAMVLVSQEISRCFDLTKGLLESLNRKLSGESITNEESSFESLYQDAKGVDQHIMDYISAVFSAGALSQDQSEDAAGLMSVVTDIDRICDRCNDIVTTVDRVNEEKRSFSKSAVEEMTTCARALIKMFKRTAELMDGASPEEVEKIASSKKKVRKAIKKFGKAHLARVKSGECDKAMGTYYTDILGNMDRIGDNCVSISEDALDNVHLVSEGSLGLGTEI